MVVIMQQIVPAQEGVHGAHLPEGARGISVLPWVADFLVMYIIADTARPYTLRAIHIVTVGKDMTAVLNQRARFVGSAISGVSYHVFMED